MHFPYRFHGFVISTFLLASSAAYAGSPVPEGREPPPGVCEGGPQEGVSCASDDECPTSRCKINYLRGPGTAFSAEITLVVDDDVSKFDGTQEVPDVIAATALLEFKHRGERHILAQTYQNLERSGDIASFIVALQQGPFLADSDSPISNRRIAEIRLNAALTPGAVPSLLDSFLFEEGDNEMSNALRAIFGVTGRPIVASTPEDISLVQHFDHLADGLASLVRLKVRVRFVAQ